MNRAGLPNYVERPARPAGPTWLSLCTDLEPMVHADLQQTYGVDLSVEHRCWHWWRDRVRHLLTVPPQIIVTPRGQVIEYPQTRLGIYLTTNDT